MKRELAEKVIAELEDELEGICSYDCLYKMLEENDMHEEAMVIERIANDEYKHANKLWDMLGKHEIEIPQKIHTMWDKVEEIFD